MQLLSNIKRYIQLKKSIKMQDSKKAILAEFISRSVHTAEAAKRNGLGIRLGDYADQSHKEIAQLKANSVIIRIISLFI